MFISPSSYIVSSFFLKFSLVAHILPTFAAMMHVASGKIIIIMKFKKFVSLMAQLLWFVLPPNGKYTPSRLERRRDKRLIVLAIVKYGMFIVDASGKVGGTVLSKNRGGSYAKNWASPINRRTTYQLAIRNLNTEFSQMWRTLTPTQQNAWIAAAPSFPYVNPVGEIKTLSGFNLFCKLNINLSLVGVAPILVPPILGTVPAVTSVTGTSLAGVVRVTYTPTPVPANTAFALWATGPLSTGKFFVKNQFRLIGFIDTTTVSPFTASVLYSSRFGIPVIGAKVFIGLQPVNKITGQTGLRLETSFIPA